MHEIATNKLLEKSSLIVKKTLRSRYLLLLKRYNVITTKLTFNCSKSKIEILEKGVKYV